MNDINKKVLILILKYQKIGLSFKAATIHWRYTNQ